MVRKMVKREKIKFEDLMDLLHLNTEDDEDYDAYIKRLEEKIKSDGFNDYIINKKHECKTEIIEEIVHEYNYFHTITIQNLDIKIAQRARAYGDVQSLWLGGFPSIGLSHPAINHTHIKVLNNKFISDQSTNKRLLEINLYDNSYIIFDNNKFNNVNIRFAVSGLDNIFFKLKNNIFNNDSVTFYPDLELYLNTINDPQNSHHESLKNNTAQIIGNEFTKLHIDQGIDFFFRGNNKIKRLIANNISRFNVDWRLGQEIDEENCYAYPHKKLFIKLKKKAIKNHDRFQELVFNSEIMHCDDKILRKRDVFDWEKFNFDWNAFQDKIVFTIGKIFSNHGTSWLKPLGCLLFMNMMIALNYNCLDCCDPPVWQIFWDLFNPLSNLADNEKIMNADETNLSFLNAAQKLLYAGLAYEIIRVFRRFTVR